MNIGKWVPYFFSSPSFLFTSLHFTFFILCYFSFLSIPSHLFPFIPLHFLCFPLSYLFLSFLSFPFLSYLISCLILSFSSYSFTSSSFLFPLSSPVFVFIHFFIFFFSFLHFLVLNYRVLLSSPFINLFYLFLHSLFPSSCHLSSLFPFCIFPLLSLLSLSINSFLNFLSPSLPFLPFIFLLFYLPFLLPLVYLFSSSLFLLHTFHLSFPIPPFPSRCCSEPVHITDRTRQSTQARINP